uniref:Triadin n=1 Tax=Scleropages formosus TaxID=113540 RepID=A0A8C9TXE2_SCLFO
MTETAVEGGGRTSSTTTVVDSKNGDVVSSPSRAPRKTVTDDLYATFSSPMAWILVLALIITWSAVAVIMFDLLDYKGLTGRPSVYPVWVTKVLCFCGTEVLILDSSST